MGGQPASDPSINSRSDKKDSDRRVEIKSNSFPHGTSATSTQTLDVTGGGHALSLQNLAKIGQVHPGQAIDPDDPSSIPACRSCLSSKAFAEVAQSGSSR